MVDYSFIAGKAPEPLNPLQTISGWQDLANKVQLNKNMKLENETGQQALDSTIGKRNAQILFGLANRSDEELPGAVKQVLKSYQGEMAKDHHDILTQFLEQNIDNPTALRRVINGGLATTMAGPEAAKFLMGTPGSIDQGATMQGVVQGGLGSSAPGALLSNGPAVPIGGPTNAQLIARTTGPVGPEGEETNVPLGAITTPNLLRPGPPGAAVAPGAAQGAGAGTGAGTGPASPFPTGVRPPPAGTGGSTAAPGLPGQIQTSLGAGTKETIQSEREAAGKAGIALTNTDDIRPQAQALLADILTQANVPNAFTSPDAPGFKALMARLSVIPGVVTPEVLKGVSAMDQMEKAMSNFQTLMMSNMIGTNAGLAQTIAGAPHMELSKGGLQGNVHQLQGTLDAQEAMSNAWRQARDSGTPPGDFKKWQNNFIKATPKGQFDPRVFWLRRMNHDEITTFMKAANDKNIARNFEYMKSQGLIQ